MIGRVWRIVLVVAALMAIGVAVSVVLSSAGPHTRTTTFTVRTGPTHP